jgi:membrane protease YdiL (CAAX protease family)
MVILTMVLASSFTYALYAPSAWAKLVLIVLTAALGYALWQKVRDRVPFLLDPDEVPARALAVADGVIAALAFFVLQGLLAPIFAMLELPAGASLLLAFVGAGSVVAGATLLVLARARVPDLLASLGFRRPRQGLALGILGGVAGGLACGLLATGFLDLVERIGFLARIRDETVALSPDIAAAAPWLAALTVLAAPLFEEFIFRGVLYGGFRRTLTPAESAVASALVFAIIHPAIASGPVFVLGLITAVLYERSRSLAPPIAAHMAYNATLVALAWWSRL